jgi:hypothetical protein
MRRSDLPLSLPPLFSVPFSYWLFGVLGLQGALLAYFRRRISVFGKQ